MAISSFGEANDGEFYVVDYGGMLHQDRRAVAVATATLALFGLVLALFQKPLHLLAASDVHLPLDDRAFRDGD